MKIILTSLMTILPLLSLFGQHKIGATLNFGISMPSNSFIAKIDDAKTKIAPAFQGGLDYNYQLTQKSALGISVLYTKADNITEQDLKLIAENSELSNDATLRSYISMNYFSIPIYYNHTFNKLSINAGIQTSFFINGKLHASVKNNGVNQSSDFDAEYDLIRESVDLGLRLGTSYNLTDKLSAQVSLYYALKNSIYDNTQSFMIRNRHLLIGVKYVFFNKK